MTAAGCELTGSWHVAALEPGQLWSSLIGQNSYGVLADPALDKITRDPLARQQAEALVILAPDPVCAILVDRALAAITDSPDTPSTATSRHRLLVVLAGVDALGAGHEPTPAQLAEVAVAVALHDPLVRDCMYGVAISARAATAQTLWARLTGSCLNLIAARSPGCSARQRFWQATAPSRHSRSAPPSPAGPTSTRPSHRCRPRQRRPPAHAAPSRSAWTA
ncbi:DUF4192 family protein [Nocardia suismassiliense]|uniref:DUF4192 family protein n=1 Tax=Nocardia suismassiliense TaxID=2077092 RepID=UPI003898F9A8